MWAAMDGVEASISERNTAAHSLAKPFMIRDRYMGAYEEARDFLSRR